MKRKFDSRQASRLCELSFEATLAIFLVLMFSASCGHKKKTIAQTPAAPLPSSSPRRPSQNVPQPSQNTASKPMPSTLPIGYTEEGVASWYGIPYHGRRAADGEIYDMETLVAAHKLMPFNTWLRVTNLSNSRTVVVRIIDRGPFIEGRIIDLSKAAARQLDLLEAGITRVRLEVIAEPRDIVSNDFFAVQVGAYTSQANAEEVRARFAQRYGSAQLEVRNGSVKTWRVLVGKFPTVESARQLANVMSGENPDIFIVRLDEAAVTPMLTPPTTSKQ